MSNRLRKTVTLLAFTFVCTAALADDPPGRVGRVSLTQGQVSISDDVGEPAVKAQVNWPVTSHNTITTAIGARTELRIGSTSIQLDGDSALDVTELDDDNLRLRLYYGSASIRIVDEGVLQGFELATSQARVRLQQPGRIRVDAERVLDTSTVRVLDGVAQIEGGATQLTIRAGRRADVQDDEVRTAQATSDAFDDWAYSRDQYGDRSQSTRYVTSDMTGYEDLDRYGSWSTSAEYGALWTPSVGSGWVPYSDGSWTWIEPWGWTWVDNAPWGYAPFHYGRWVYVSSRWRWTPGARDLRPVWAPALVGWVGGANWNLTFRDRRQAPALGWYPLTPHDRFEPWFRTSDENRRWWNRNLRPENKRDQGRRAGLTVVPHDAFRQRDRVEVSRMTRPAQPAVALQNVPSAPPPSHQGARPDRDRFAPGRFDRGQRPPVLTAPTVVGTQPQPRPQPQPQPQPRPAAVFTPAPPVPNEQAQSAPRARHGDRDTIDDIRRLNRAPIETGGQPFERPAPAPVPGTVIGSQPETRPAPGTVIGSQTRPGPAPGTVIGSQPRMGPAPGTVIGSQPNMGPAPGTAIGSQPPGPAPLFVPAPERSHREGGQFEHRGEHRGQTEPRWREANATPRPAPQPAVAPAAPPFMAPQPPAAAPPQMAAPRPAPAPAESREHRHRDSEDHVRQQER